MIVLAIDPGYIESAICLYDGEKPIAFGKSRNEEVLASVGDCDTADWLVVEQMKNYGMPAGDEILDTVLWSGRFIERWDAMRSRLLRSTDAEWSRITRKAVAGHICNNAKANDSNIRQAIIDRYGGRDAAIGKKKTPGPLFGMTKDCWSAMALAITWHETRAATEATP